MGFGVGSDRITPSYFAKWLYNEHRVEDSEKIKQIKTILAFIFSLFLFSGHYFLYILQFNFQRKIAINMPNMKVIKIRYF